MYTHCRHSVSGDHEMNHDNRATAGHVCGGGWLGFEDRLCVVTGAGGGIGAEIASQLIEVGARVALLDRNEEAVTKVAAGLAGGARRAMAIHCDVTSAQSIEAAAAQVQAAWGPAAVLVNNAASLYADALMDIQLESWNQLLAVNLTGYLLCAQAFGRQMIAHGSGCMVHVASIAATVPQPYSGAYSVSKAGVAYDDAARHGDGMSAMMRMMDARKGTPPFAPPFLQAGKLVIAQTANILLYLGSRHGLAPKTEAGKLWVHQLQLTIADLVLEIHDTHHPLGPSLYYEDQRTPAKKRTEEFWNERVPKYLGYFEGLMEEGGKAYVTGRKATYVDLSLFQIVAGLRYAFPKRMKAFEREIPRLIELHDRVAARPNINAYLESDRRIAFNEQGIFRRYKELDR